jgi:hypothetical protein
MDWFIFLLICLGTITLVTGSFMFVFNVVLPFLEWLIRKALQ